jgi:hypothetical protein
MELLLLGLFGAVYYSFAVFSTGYFVSFVSLYLLCSVILNSKINIKNNNDLFSIFCNNLHLILTVSSISCEFIIFKMKQNTYLYNVFRIYDIMNSTFLNVCYKVKQILCGCCTSKELKTPKEINQFLDSIND